MRGYLMFLLMLLSSLTTISTETTLCIQAGYVGVNCTEDRDECQVGKQDLCKHRGVCNNTIGSYRCFCLNGWTGSHCETNVSTSPECMPGYNGSQCETSQCQNGYAVDNRNANGLNCTCDQGWNHTRNDEPCNIDIDECADVPSICQHNGTCTNSQGSYTCQCVSPWQGENCTFYNSCVGLPCKNGGICTPSTDRSYLCRCPEGWSGDNCTEYVDECTETSLSRKCTNGNCTNSLGSFNCTCDDGWSGNHCNESLSPSTTAETVTSSPPSTTTETVTSSSPSTTETVTSSSLSTTAETVTSSPPSTTAETVTISPLSTTTETILDSYALTTAGSTMHSSLLPAAPTSVSKVETTMGSLATSSENKGSSIVPVAVGASIAGVVVIVAILIAIYLRTRLMKKMLVHTEQPAGPSNTRLTGSESAL